jgi:2-polyprenyl-6-methoxyphenol hydroxylase-like FAD-dependent oxidoreductase
VDELRGSYDLVVAADGINSAVRTKYADAFVPSLDQRTNKYIWLGTDRVFEAFQFLVKQTEFGTMQIHGYPFSDSGSTFIVEMHEDVWRKAGLDATEGTQFPPGVSDEQSVARIREIFADELAGHNLLTNNSRSGSTSRRSATSAGTTTTWSCSATPPTPRTSRSAPAPSWPWRTPSRSPRVCTNTPPWTRR